MQFICKIFFKKLCIKIHKTCLLYVLYQNKRCFMCIITFLWPKTSVLWTNLHYLSRIHHNLKAHNLYQKLICTGCPKKNVEGALISNQKEWRRFSTLAWKIKHVCFWLCLSVCHATYNSNNFLNIQWIILKFSHPIKEILKICFKKFF